MSIAEVIVPLVTETLRASAQGQMSRTRRPPAFRNLESQSRPCCQNDSPTFGGRARSSHSIHFPSLLQPVERDFHRLPGLSQVRGLAQEGRVDETCRLIDTCANELGICANLGIVATSDVVERAPPMSGQTLRCYSAFLKHILRLVL